MPFVNDRLIFFFSLNKHRLANFFKFSIIFSFFFKECNFFLQDLCLIFNNFLKSTANLTILHLDFFDLIIFLRRGIFENHNTFNTFFIIKICEFCANYYSCILIVFFSKFNLITIVCFSNMNKLSKKRVFFLSKNNWNDE